MSNKLPHPLDYAPRPDPKPWPTWAVLTAMVIWPLVVLNIWCTAFLSLTFTAVGIVNLFHPCIDHWPTGKNGIHWTNASWIICNASLAAIFVPLAAWHWRWRRRHRDT